MTLRIRHALGTLAGAALVAAVAVPVAVLARPEPAADPGGGPSASSSSEPTTASPSASLHTTLAAVDQVPPDFPLTAGYPETNGHDHSPVQMTTQSGVADLVFCGRTAWSPVEPVRTVDIAGATYTGEAEDFRGRALALYDGGDAAGRALLAIHDALARCPSETISGGESVRTIVDRTSDSLVVTRRWRGGHGFDTGLEVIQAVRRGPALYLAFAYGAGGGSDESIAASIDQLLKASTPVVDALCAFTADGCSPTR